MHKVPAGYTQRTLGTKNICVQAEHAEVIAGALAEGQGCVPIPDAGRGTVYRFEYPGGAGIVRRYLRGGAARFLMKDAYFLANRPLREFRIHLHLYEQGLAVPKVLGVCWERRGVTVRGAIATQALSAENLSQCLAKAPGNIQDTLRQCGALIRRMHDLHVWHADLQIKNILVGEGGPWLIDFDNAVHRPNLSPMLRARNLLRLRRSMEKNGFPPEYFAPLCEGYGTEALPEWLSRMYILKGRLSDMARGKRPMS